MQSGTQSEPKNYGYFYVGRYRQSLLNGEYQKALEYALKGFLVASELDDEVVKKAFMGLIRTALEKVEAKDTDSAEVKGNPVCSFCGTPSDAVEVMLGADGCICKNCASRIYSHFFK